MQLIKGCPWEQRRWSSAGHKVGPEFFIFSGVSLAPLAVTFAIPKGPSLIPRLPGVFEAELLEQAAFFLCQLGFCWEAIRNQDTVFLSPHHRGPWWWRSRLT